MSPTAVQPVDAGRRRISRRVEVAARPEEIFEMLADPGRHGEVDGSGTVRDAVSGPDRLGEGSRFSVNMRMFGLPYRITSTVVEFEPGRRIAWRHPGRHIWRWELEPAGEGRTAVTETFDYAGAPGAPVYEWAGMTRQNAEGITRTLLGLRERFGG